MTTIQAETIVFLVGTCVEEIDKTSAKVIAPLKPPYAMTN